MSDDLGLDALSDDQLVALVRAALREITGRDPGVRSAVEAAMLDESERARIARAAGEKEAGILRARERERVAADAAAEIRRQHAAQEAEIAVQRGQAARERVAAEEYRRLGWVKRAYDLTHRPSEGITMMVVSTKYGRRLIINRGSDRYTKDHLIDAKVDGTRISSTRALIPSKPDFAALAAELSFMIGTAESLVLYYHPAGATAS